MAIAQANLNTFGGRIDEKPPDKPPIEIGYGPSGAATGVSMWKWLMALGVGYGLVDWFRKTVDPEALPYDVADEVAEILRRANPGVQFGRTNKPDPSGKKPFVGPIDWSLPSNKRFRIPKTFTDPIGNPWEHFPSKPKQPIIDLINPDTGRDRDDPDPPEWEMDDFLERRRFYNGNWKYPYQQ